MKKQLDIEIIVSGIKQGNAVHQRALLDLFADQLYSIALRYVRDTDKAQEVVQDTFIKVFKAINNFDPQKGKIDAWMRKICIRIALRYLNKKEVPLTVLDEVIENSYGTDPTFLENFDDSELMGFVMRLPEGYRQVFNLYVIEGYSHKEIANMLGIKEVSSRSNLHRAKDLLRKNLMTHKNYESWAAMK